MSTATTPPQLFDRRQVRQNRDRAAAAFADHDFLLREVADRLLDRLADVKREFTRVLDLGGHGGLLGEGLRNLPGNPQIVEMDLSAGMLARSGAALKLQGDEELLPFAPGSFDLVVSNMSLHWVNDLPGVLVQVRQVLKEDGLFIASLFGANSLINLKSAFMTAESEIRQGVRRRVSPFLDLQQAGALLQRCGYALPVVDYEDINVSFASPFALMKDLRGMGEGGALVERARHFARRDVFMAAATQMMENQKSPDGRVEDSFEILWLHGWTPHVSQQQPLKPGSAKTSLAAVLKDSPES